MTPRYPTDPKVDRVLDELPAELRRIGKSLRSVVRANAPSLRERFKWGNPIWAGRGNAVPIIIYPDHLNLGLSKGAQLASKYRESEGTGEGLRHVKIR